MPSDIETSWTAGIIDADGCVTMNKMAKTSAFRKPMVAVDNTDFEIIEELVRLYGGKITKKKKYKKHHRQAWSWRMYGADQIIAMLSAIVPFMHCTMKRNRASLLLNEYKYLTPRNGWYTPEMRILRLDFETRFLAIGAGRGSQCKAA